MKIIISEHSGFCEGVQLAYKKAIAAAQKDKPLYMLGSLVHSSAVVEQFKGLGVIKVRAIKDIPKDSDGTLLISAHGVTPRTIEEAKSRGLKIIDTTCAWVKRAQKLAKQFNENNYHVIIVGDRGHPEVAGIVGWANDNASIIEEPKGISSLPNNKSFGIIAQTTQSKEKFDKIVAELEASGKSNKNIIVYNTICNATTRRQDSAARLSREVDVMLVVGDKKSANTKRLYQLCRSINKNTHWIQSKGELKTAWLKNRKTTGITAGASTPGWLIQEVIKEIEKI